MHKGHVDAATHTYVAGWAADTDRPNEPQALSILIDGVHAGTIAADRMRPDLAARAEFGDGRHGFRFTYAAPLDETKPHRISVRYFEDGGLLPRGDIILAPRQPEPSPPPSLIPILITAPGRSGTTLLMGLLAHAPEIIAAELYPMETRLLAYYAVAQNVLSHPADIVRSTHQDKLHGDGFYVGFNPYNSGLHTPSFPTPAIAQDYADHFVPEMLDACFAELITRYYRLLAQDKSKPEARFFAEKNNNIQLLVRRFTRRAFGVVREIVMVRDPRDVFCSYQAYFKVDSNSAFSELNHTTRTLLELYQKPPADVHFCKYEDLLNGDKACFAALSAFLGTQIVQRPVEYRQSSFGRHATSANPRASVERWRGELSLEMKRKCNAAWRPFLEAFGYALE